MPTNEAPGRYELKELLGEGGMGVVYRARDTRTNTDVAIKTMRDASDPATLEMFKREWAELAKLCHPNIVDVRDVDEIVENGVRKPCFIMPLLPGVTLAQLIKKASPRLTVEFVVDIISQVCRGLQAAHECDLIHRDLKPSNIFIGNDDTAKIIDFGLVHTATSKSVTGLKGTWQYMSPEQVEGKPCSRRSDIFSLGIVAYEALTGDQPFKRQKLEETVEAIKGFIPQSISEKNPKVPQLVSKAVQLAMAKQPLHRYASAREFAETLQRAYNNQYIERFDPVKIRPRIDRAKKAFASGDSDFASEILTELEAEGNLDAEITLLRAQINESIKQKRIRQLFEGAQTRLEQDELPLALDKLSEILNLDSDNQEALSMRKRIDQQRSQQQVSEWLRLARQHLERNDFAEARHALKEVFNLRYDEAEAARLTADVDAREREASKARAEKELLYGGALKAHETGENSTALSKLQRILDLSHNIPGARVPERDKVFEAFYNDVRSEQDRITNVYAEGSRLLDEKQFDKTLQICDEILSRYPKNEQFRALRFKAEQAQRQFLSAYIAEVGRAVDSEPNLERRVGILEDACNRYPNEAQFQRQLGLAREHLALVTSILMKAKSYEEAGQFSEAVQQWKILSNIHPQYPGIDFEITQLERRREHQAEEDTRSRLVERIDRALENSAFTDAERLAQQGLAEFPNNPELTALLRIARQGTERAQQAETLFQEAKAHRAAGRLQEAVDVCRQAFALDKRNIVTQNTLVNLLVELAQNLLDREWATAEKLAMEASELDPENRSVRRVLSSVAQNRRKEEIDQFIYQAREQQSQDPKKAIETIEQALLEYPADPRLIQIRTSLQNQNVRPSKPPSPPVELPHTVALSGLTQTQGLDRTRVYPAAPAPAAPGAHMARSVPAPPKPAVTQPPTTPVDTAKKPPNDFLKKLIDFFQGLSWTVRGLAAAGILLVVALTYKATHPGADKPVPTAVVKKDPKTAAPPPVVTPAAPAGPAAPEPLRVHVSTSEVSGVLMLDGASVANIQNGEAEFSVPPGDQEHHLIGRNKTGDLFNVTFKLPAEGMPTVGPLTTRDLIVVGSRGSQAMLYSGSPGRVLAIEGKERTPIPPTGLAVNLDETPDGIPIAGGPRRQTIAVAKSDAPGLSVSLNANPNLGTLIITASVKGATLTLNGEPVPAPRSGTWVLARPPGKYTAKVSAPGMQDDDFELNAAKGGTDRHKSDLKALPAMASLIIANGNPNTSVLLDGKKIGELSAEGAFEYPGVSPGLHEIQLQKEGYDSVTSKQNFFAGRRMDLPGNIKPGRSVGFAIPSVTPAGAAIHYRRAGENDLRSAEPGTSLSLAPGKYEFSAGAEHFVEQKREITIEAGKTQFITFALSAAVVTKVSPFVHPDQVKQVGDWSSGLSKEFVALRPGMARLLINFLRPDRFPAHTPKPKKLIWQVTLPDGQNRIQYSLDAHTLTVAKTVGGEQIKPYTENVDATDTSDTVSIHITLESHGVRISKKDGTLFDTFNDDKSDWSHATIAVKGDAYFVVWPGL